MIAETAGESCWLPDRIVLQWGRDQVIAETHHRGPRGRDPRLGKELDVVLAIRTIRNIDMNSFAGLFLPDTAFSGPVHRAFLFRQEFKYYF